MGPGEFPLEKSYMQAGVRPRAGEATEAAGLHAGTEAGRLPTPEQVLRFECEQCSVAVDCPVWHCPICDRHLLAATEICDDCQSPRPALCRSWVVVGSRLYLTPFAVLFPDLHGAEYDSFRDDIRQWGIRVPVILDERGAVIDGRQRLRVAAELGIHVENRVSASLSDEEKLRMCLRYNLHRRNITSRG
jgi:hypothetical protein